MDDPQETPDNTSQTTPDKQAGEKQVSREQALSQRQSRQQPWQGVVNLWQGVQKQVAAKLPAPLTPTDLSNITLPNITLPNITLPKINLRKWLPIDAMQLSQAYADAQSTFQKDVLQSFMVSDEKSLIFCSRSGQNYRRPKLC
ncbi:MAG: hypothetical protein HC800_10385 [Phormidesmis sp. RL_2_1]|nr:hypothetical protein [Phormidesmis sp. RL_2_1]